MRYFVIISILFSIPAFAETVTLQPGPDIGKDAFVLDDLPNNNYGNNADLRISGLSAGSRYLSYIEFDELDKYIGNGHTVTSAQLSLYLYNGSGTGTVSLFVVSSAWDEGTINWNNVPSNESPAFLTDAFDPSAGWKTYDVKSVVQDWLDTTKPNYGFFIRGNTGETFTAKYRSSDFGTETNRPKLVVTSPTMAIESRSLGQIKAVFK